MNEQWSVPPPPGSVPPVPGRTAPPEGTGPPAFPLPPTPTAVLTPPPYRGAPPPEAPADRSRAGRPLWRAFGAFFAVVALFFSAVQVLGVLSLDSSVLQRSVSADGVTGVVVRADHGTVQVVGTDGGDVTVEARVRRSLVDADVSVRRGTDDVVVRGTCPGFSPGFCAVDLVVRVPAALGVDVQGRDGDVTVRDVRGPVVVSSDDGDVVVDDIGGDLGVDVADGSVRATGLVGDAEVATDDGPVDLSFREAPRSVSVSSGNGDIEIVVPDGAETYRVDATSGDGAVDTRVRTDPSAASTMALRSSDGSITVRYPA